jgi:hypothetical protein
MPRIRAMDNFLEVLKNIRLGCAEVAGTITLVFLLVYGLYKAWQDFIRPLWK